MQILLDVLVLLVSN